MTELQKLRELTDRQPLARWTGLELLDAGAGWVKERLPIRQEFLQPHVVHGGIIYTLADTAAAHALLSLIYPEEWATTVEQKINFLRPVTKGSIVAHGKVVHMGNRIAYCEVEVFNDAEQLIAKSTATIMRIPARPVSS